MSIYLRMPNDPSENDMRFGEQMTLLNSYLIRTLDGVVKTVTSRDGLKQLWRVRLYSNTFYLVLTSGISSFLGFVFWIIVARLYTPDDVGLASALIAAVALLAGFTHLGLDVALVRFLSESGKNANSLINTVFTIITFASIVGSSIFVVGLDFWSPALLFMRRDPFYLTAFVCITIVFNAAHLLDRTFIAERRSGYTVAKSTILGLLRLPLLVLLAASFHSFGIFASWGIALLVVVLLGTFIFMPRVRPGYRPSLVFHRDVVNEIMSFSFVNYIADFFWGASSLLLPILVLNLLGAESTAYFYIAWSVGSACVMVAGAVSTTLFAEASYDRKNLGLNIWRSLKLIFLTLVPVIILLLAFAPKLLLIFGTTYSESGVGLLRIVAISALPWSINLVYLAKLRVEKKSKVIMGFTALVAILSLGIAYFLLPWMGVSGAGVAWLTTHGILALVVTATSFRGKQVVSSARALLSRNKGV